MISLIGAMSENHVIGIDNQIPWHIKSELAYFKSVTLGHSIVMGRNTFESIGRPLPGRVNYVVTRDTSYRADGCHILHTIDDVLKLNATDEREIFVIGGEMLYKAFLPYADRIYLTVVHGTYKGDAFFPAFNRAEFRKISEIETNEEIPYTRYIYERLVSGVGAANKS